jgi:hypothetical protein
MSLIRNSLGTSYGKSNLTDLFHDWKSNRFVRYPGDEFNVRCVHLIILTDISFWHEHIDELKQWCQDSGCHPEGMTVEIPSDELYTAFCLRWA